MLDASDPSEQAQNAYRQGRALHEQGQFEAAQQHYMEALKWQPDHFDALHCMGMSAGQSEHFEGAIDWLNKALAVNPHSVAAQINLANSYRGLKQFDKALECYNQALALDANRADAYHNRGGVLIELKQFAAALESYNQAIELEPNYIEAHWNKGLLLLLLGDLQQGWQKYEWRRQTKDFPSPKRSFTQVLWSGSQTLSGKTILLHFEQGLGDTIQFCRYAKLVKNLGAHVILEVHPPLLKLLTSLEGVDELIPYGAPLPDFDFHCPLLSLPLAFNTDLSTIPAPQRYLSSNLQKIVYWQNRLGKKHKPRLGIVWCGNPNFKEDSARSLSLAAFLALIPDGFECISLKKDLLEHDHTTLQAHPTILHFGDELQDFSDTAALCELMDTIVTTDTSVAHLAGALGKPVWILLPYLPDWRWLLDRSDSPWYPSATLYRQTTPGDWDGVFARVKADLQRLLLPSEQAQNAYRQGRALHEQGQLDAAQQHYTEALKWQPNHFDALHCMGMSAGQSEHFEEAIDWLNKALAVNPHSVAAQINLANSYKGLQQFDKALECYNQALALDVNRADAYFNRGVALTELKQFNTALDSFQYAIALKPDYAEAHALQGTIFTILKQTDAALSSYKRAIELKPDYAEAYSNQGVALAELKQYDAALNSYQRAIELKPNYAEAYYNQGIALAELKQYDAAIDSYQHAIELKPNDSKAYYNQGIVLAELKQYDAAIDSYQHAIELKPNYAEAYYNQGITLAELKQYNAALNSYQRAIELKPDYVEAYSNQSIVLAELKQFDAALDSYQHAIELKPDYAEAHFNYGFLLLLIGHLPVGWQEYEWRWKKKDFSSPQRPFTQPLWSGTQALSGQTILLYFEQGLGDTIQFCRYAQLVKNLGARVILEVHPPLLNLFTSLEGVDELIPYGAPLPDFDCHCPLLSLPLAFNTDLNTVPAPQRYLSTNLQKIAHWQHRLGEKHKPRLGIICSGNPEHKNDSQRSIALELFLTLVPDGFQCINLQKVMRASDLEVLQQHPEILYLGDELQDFSDTAALCELMDVIISVDTSIAHLAGALGKPVWILLPYSPDWRWLLDRSDSPWYPSATLYRQTKLDDWASVFEHVKSDLQHMLDDGNEAYLLFKRAIESMENKQLNQALAHLDRAIELSPRYLAAYNLRGSILLERKAYTTALENYEQALIFNPYQADIYCNRGMALAELGQYNAALDAYNHSIQLNPHYVQTYSNRGNVLARLQQYDAAFDSFAQAIALNNQYAETYCNRGTVFAKLKQFDQALADYNQAIELEPNYIETHWNKGLLLLLLGDLQPGWIEYEYRLQEKSLLNAQTQPFTQPKWSGTEPLHNKTIFLHPEQGLGDIIQFCRYTKLVKDLGARVILECPQALCELMIHVEGIDVIIHHGSPIPDFDFHCPLLSLPLAFNTDLNTIPAPPRYLSANRQKIAYWQNRLGKKHKPRLGIVWCGNPNFKEDQSRSVSLASFLALIPDGFECISLKKELLEHDYTTLQAHPTIHHFGDELQDFSDTAALCELMDVIISVDTSVAHLAGALGKPVWILLPYSPDWRWLLDRSDSPWYPSATLYRQTTPGDWDGVFARVKADLQSWIKGIQT